MTPTTRVQAGSKRDASGLLLLLAAGLIVFLILLSPAAASAQELGHFAPLAQLQEGEGR